MVNEARLHEARQEARIEAAVFTLAGVALLIALGITSLVRGWELRGIIFSRSILCVSWPSS